MGEDWEAAVETPRVTRDRARRLRRELTLPEVALWAALRGKRLRGLRFRRQHPIGPYILDFYCDELRLAVEVDGQIHDQPDALRHDARRDEWLAAKGIRVHRVGARDVLTDLGPVLEGILAAAGRAPD
jgi:very-short-patch-repair endonuclease